MTREQIERDYRHEGVRITSPGKFEGSPLYAVALWEEGLDGFADQDDGNAYAFRVRAEDRATWPEIPAETVWLVLRESDNGFVSVEQWQEDPAL